MKPAQVLIMTPINYTMTHYIKFRTLNSLAPRNRRTRRISYLRSCVLNDEIVSAPVTFVIKKEGGERKKERKTNQKTKPNKKENKQSPASQQLFWRIFAPFLLVPKPSRLYLKIVRVNNHAITNTCSRQVPCKTSISGSDLFTSG